MSPLTSSETAQSVSWPALLLMAMLPLIMTGWPHWSLFVLPACVFALICWTQVVRPMVRARRMRTPYGAYFRIDDSGKRPLEAHAKPDSTVHIQINREIEVTHLEHELIVGFDGDPESKPRIVSVENRFVKLGRIRECSPDTTDEHYIDVKDNYHIKRDQQLVRDNTYSSGFFCGNRGTGSVSDEHQINP